MLLFCEPRRSVIGVARGAALPEGTQLHRVKVYPRVQVSKRGRDLSVGSRAHFRCTTQYYRFRRESLV